MGKLKYFSLFLILLTSCYHFSTKLKPAPMPSDWRWKQAEEIMPPQVEEWWEIFNDPVLNELEEQALATSPTLDLALYKVEQARAHSNHSFADLFPNLTIKPDFSQIGQLLQNPAPSPGAPPEIRFVTRAFNVPFNLSYEADLFGRLYYHAESEYASLEAQKAAFYTARLLLTTDVAKAYFSIKGDRTKVEILKQAIQRREIAYEVNKARFDAGQVNYTDVSQADFQRQRAQADLRVVEEDLAKQENLLSRLTSLFSLPLIDDLKGEPPLIPAGIPSELLLRRPNLIDALYQIISDAEQVKSAKAALFPSFIFTGNLGYSSPDFEHVLTWLARYWTWQLSMVQTILDFGRKFDDVEEARALFMQAVSNYRELVLEAIQEVEDALSGIKLIKEELIYTRNSIAAAQISIDLFRERYLKGLVNYLEVVTSEEDLLSAQQNEADADTRLFLATVNLVKALGGDFRPIATDDSEICSSPDPVDSTMPDAS